MLKVSIIIPAYNPGTYLDIALASVAAQTFTDWELIVVDDGSTEDIRPIVNRYPGTRLIQQENQGLSAARNAGIASATGEYIAFLDADDCWQPDKLRQQMVLMEANSNLALCHTQFDLVDAEGVKIGNGFGGGMNSYTELLDGCGIGVSTVIVRKSCLLECGLFDLRYKSVQDYDLWLRIAQRHAIVGLSASLAQYRLHGQNMSLRYMDMYREMRTILQGHHANACRNNNAEAIAAAQTGLQKIRVNFGRQGFEQCRITLRHKHLAAFMVHAKNTLYIAPNFVLTSIVQHNLKPLLPRTKKM